MRAEAAAVVLAGCLCWMAPVGAEEAPSLELLQFLGSFETANGQWIDPTRLPSPAPAAPAETPEGVKEKSNEKE